MGKGFFADVLGEGAGPNGHDFAADMDLVQVAMKDHEGGIVEVAGEDDVMSAAQNDGAGLGKLVAKECGYLVGGFGEVGDAAARGDLVGVVAGEGAVVDGFHGIGCRGKAGWGLEGGGELADVGGEFGAHFGVT